MLGYVATYWMTPSDGVNAILYVNPLVRMVDFYLGMLSCRLFVQRKTFASSGQLEVVLLVILLMSLVVYPFVGEKFRNAPLYWMVLIPLILVFAQEEGPVSRWLNTKPMLFLGSLTMPVFLTHQMLIGILLRRLPEMPVVLMLAACIFVVLSISWGIQIIIPRLLR